MKRISTKTITNLKELKSKRFTEVKTVIPKVSDLTSAHLSPQLEQDVVQFTQKSPLDNFKIMCLKLPENASKEELANLKSNFSILRNEAKAENYLDSFCNEAGDFSIELMSSNNKAFRQLGLVFSGDLIKTQCKNGNYNEVIKLANASALSHAQNKDAIHVLSRLHSLQVGYQATGQKSKAYETQKLAYKYANKIINNYDEAVKNFHSISSKPKPIESFYKEKAHIGTDLAIMTAHKNRTLSVKYLKEIIAIYQKLGLKKETIFTVKQLERLKTSPIKNKLKEVSSEEIRSYTNSKFHRLVKTKPIKASGATAYRKITDEDINKFFGKN